MAMMKRHQDPEAQAAVVPLKTADDDEDEEKFEVTSLGKESHARSLMKGISWRIFATLTTMTIAWYITGTLKTAFEIGFIEFFIKIGIYYVHERIWAAIRI